MSVIKCLWCNEFYDEEIEEYQCEECEKTFKACDFCMEHYCMERVLCPTCSEWY